MVVESSRSYSIKDALNGNFKKPETNIVSENSTTTTSEEETYTAPGNSSFSRSDLMNKWNEYISTMLVNKPRLASIFTNKKPEFINDFTLKIKTFNKLQHDEVTNTSDELNAYLKKSLDNGTINIVVELDETVQNHDKKYYTDDDKLKFLCKKNPSIAKFAKLFNLDFD